MAKKKSAARTQSRAMVPAGAKSITVNVPRPVAVRSSGNTKPAKRKGGGRRRGGGGGGDSIMQVLGYPGLAGLILGYIDKGAVQVPTVPFLGRAGTLAFAAYFFRKHHHALPKIAGGMAAIALYEWQREGSVAGYGDGVAAAFE